MNELLIDIVTPESLSADDIERLNELESQIFGTGGYPRYFFRQAAEIFDGTFLVARNTKGKIVAYVLGAVSQHSLDEAWILSMCVDQPERKKGIGSILLQTLCKILKEKHVEQVFVTVEPGNEAAQHLYEKDGFVMTTIRENYHGATYHRYLMKKKLV
ncbi:MAG: GNAT family N-acetyltransferase [Candidatus Aenigmarchaeota archaeon]|nr:GNAT family N-acetyltransferase [Candidatus Aenigmarchaeota archaeon]